MPLPLILAGAALGGGIGFATTGTAKGALYGAGAGALTAGFMGAAPQVAASMGGLAGPPSMVAGGIMGTGMSGATAMMAGGAGMMAAQMAGGSSTGFAPQEKITLTGPGKELYGNLQEQSDKKLADVESGDIGNLAKQFIPGMLNKAGQATRGAAQGLTKTMGRLGDTSGRVGGTRTGRIAKAAMAKGGQRVNDLRAAGEWMGSNIRGEYVNALSQQKNLMNLEQQAPVLSAQATFARNSADLAAQSNQGAAFGNLARMGGMMTIMSRVNNRSAENG